MKNNHNNKDYYNPQRVLNSAELMNTFTDDYVMYSEEL